MKTLFLMRHAKSSWNDPGLDDYDRPLNPRGLRAGPAMGEYMAEKNYRPQIILCSSARRTLETLSLIKPYIGVDVPTRVEDELYLASASTILSLVQEIEDTHGSAMVIGHNPGLEDCLAMLMRAQPGTEIPVMPTAALGVLEFDTVTWSKVSEGQGTLLDFATPKGMDGND